MNAESRQSLSRPLMKEGSSFKQSSIHTSELVYITNDDLHIDITQPWRSCRGEQRNSELNVAPGYLATPLR
jgi:hypothetical protein